MKTFINILILNFVCILGFGQTNITLKNPIASDILHANYNPADYSPSQIINSADSILRGIVNEVSTDSLFSYLKQLDSFYNRNTGSDTISSIHGIGAARRWIYSKYLEFSEINEDRLVVTYNDFSQMVCGKNKHRNVLAILPGLDTTNNEILLIEGHFDTRCEDACDTTCYTPGMDDNGSGTVLVMELARVMSRFAFDRTIIFASVTGEDQGLYGARALASYCSQENINLLAVLNNDVVGGVICGNTSSPPSCPGFGEVDSMNVRLFSNSKWNDSTAVSPHKQLARYIKMHQEERINPLLSTPLNINLMIQEDRSGRSGDHIPFRQRGYTAVRFCSQNEFGDGTGTPPDHQHTTMDILGLDLDNPPDGIIDSFFVDMNYLRRNAIANGVNLGFLANSPKQPQPTFTALDNGLQINLNDQDLQYDGHRLGARTTGTGSLYFDTIYDIGNEANYELLNLEPDKTYMFTLMNVKNEIESFFPDEFTVETVDIQDFKSKNGLELGLATPNPSNSSVTIEVKNYTGKFNCNVELVVSDITGKEILKLNKQLNEKSNNIVLNNSILKTGIYFYSLIFENRILATKKLIIY